MPDRDGVNGPFADGRSHCAHCDQWIEGAEDELWHRENCGPAFREGVKAIERGLHYEDGAASANATNKGAARS